MRIGDRSYVSLQQFANHFDGFCGYSDLDQPLGIQPLVMNVGSVALRFENGGDRVRVGNSEDNARALKSMLLVIGDEHYAEVTELAELVGARYEDESILLGQSTFPVQPRTYPWSQKTNRVDAISCDSRLIQFRSQVTSVCTGRSEFTGVLPSGSEWHVRRALRLNEQPVALVHEAKWPFASYLVAQSDIAEHANEHPPYGTDWQNLKHQFEQRQQEQARLRHGNKQKLDRSVCLTCDFCWSLRPLEKQLTALFEHEISQRQQVSFVAFMCGRWIDQHPQEMQQLLDRQALTEYQIDWGLHSYDHPKYGEFLNAYDEAALIDDTLRNEVAMLEWGVVPSVFYRFPGLVHDDLRFSVILSLDLLTIDCESWMALVDAESRNPFSRPINNGSIILVHANGNEPEGLPPLQRWRENHTDWTFKPVRYFLT